MDSTKWVKTTWGDISQLRYGKSLKGYRDVSSGFPVFGSNGHIGFCETPLAPGPGVIVGRKGAYRGIKWSGESFWVIDTAYYLDCDGDQVGDKWAYYRLLATDINSRDSGSAIPSLSRPDFYAIPLLLPGLDEQRAIAELLGSLDDRIEWCRTTGDRVLAAIQVVAAGGQEHVPVAGLADYVNGGAFTKGADGQGRLIIKIGELTSGISASSKFTSVEARADRVANPGDILFSWSATLNVHRWTGDQALINQHIFKVIPDQVPPWLVYAKLAEAMPTFQKIAADRATTMGHIKKAHLEQVTVPLNDASQIADQDPAGTSLWERHLGLMLEARSLERTRDLLLPELVTGRLRIADVDGFLERAGLAA